MSSADKSVYIWFLENVFPSDIHEAGDSNSMYISRELDQALWVYVHATKNGHTMNTYYRRLVLQKKSSLPAYADF